MFVVNATLYDVWYQASIPQNETWLVVSKSYDYAQPNMAEKSMVARIFMT